MPLREMAHGAASLRLGGDAVPCSPSIGRVARSHAISHWPQIIDALPMRIILCDRQGRIRLLNAMSREHLDGIARGSGRIGADYLALMLERISSSCIREAFGTSFRLLINGGAGFRHPVQATTRTGDISFTVTGSAIPDEEELFIICHLPVQEEETSLPQGMIRECMFMAEEAERRRIARELHDETAQQLALIRVNLSKFISGGPDGVDPDLVEADCAVSKVQQQIRTLTYALHPPGLAEGGIAMALQCFCREMSRRTGLEVRFQNHAGAVGRCPSMESAFFRIAQEGLNNVLKHARATRVMIALKREQERLVLEVEDDGIGVPEQVTRGEFPAGVGLPGIRERLDALAGDLSIGRAEKGTRLVAAIPWQRAAAAGVTVR